MKIDRDEAAKAGLKHYFTGLPCKRGHVAKRYVSYMGCHECVKARKRAYCAANREKESTRLRVYYEANKGMVCERVNAYREKHKAEIADRKRAHAAANREEKSARAREYYYGNKAAIVDRIRAYTAANSDKVRLWSLNKRARKRNAEGTHTIADIRDRLKLQKGKCAWCKVSIKSGYHVDHIHPLSKGGSNLPSNLQLLCAHCNSSKGASDPADFARREGRLI